MAIRRRLRGGEGPVGMHGGGAGRGRLVHQFGSPELPEPSTLPFGDSTDMGYSQSNAILDLYVNILVPPTRISPRQSGAAGPCSKDPSGVHGKARIVGYVLQSAAPTGPSP